MALKIDPSTGQLYDDDPVTGWKTAYTPGSNSGSIFAADVPAATRKVFNSSLGGAGGAAGGSGGVGGGAPTGSASYVAPRAVDQTNIYENKLLRLLDNPDSIADTGAYKFRFNQGQQALERSAAAKGMTGSGNTLAALMNYGQGQAAQAYDTEADRLGGLTGVQKNYILGLMGNANQEAAGANSFNLGNQRNAIDWSLGSERNAIARLAALNGGSSGSRTSAVSSLYPATASDPSWAVSPFSTTNVAASPSLNWGKLANNYLNSGDGSWAMTTSQARAAGY